MVCIVKSFITDCISVTLRGTGVHSNPPESFRRYKFWPMSSSNPCYLDKKNPEIVKLLYLLAFQSKSDELPSPQNQFKMVIGSHSPPPTKYVRKSRSGNSNKPPLGPAPPALESSSKLGTVDVELSSSYGLMQEGDS